ncbi:MAG: response regulator [Bdellovibrionales bacterium]|nr:response regulator [Bdellovibrionales bacterium]
MEEIENPTILLVDDSNIVRMAHRKALKNGGYQQFLEAENGLEALNLIGSFPIDLIIADINMPKMDGIEFLRLLRSREEGRDIPVIIVSGSASVTNVVQAVKLQATFVLTKPVEHSLLCSNVKQALCRSVLETDANWKILVLDPLPAARKVVSNFLRELGLEKVHESSSVPEASEVLKREGCDLVIADWTIASEKMHELVGGVNRPHEKGTVPVIVTAAETTREHVLEAARSGASGFLGKPFGLQTLKQKIVSTLR